MRSRQTKRGQTEEDRITKHRWLTVLVRSKKSLSDAVVCHATKSPLCQTGQYHKNETITAAFFFSMWMWIYDTVLIVCLAQKVPELVKELSGWWAN